MADLIFKIKRFFQLHLLWPIHRAKYGWAHNDVWEFDRYLSGVIIGGLRELISMGNSYPSGYESFDKPLQVWHEELKGIIAAFEAREKFNDYMWTEHQKLEDAYNGKISKDALKKYKQRMDTEYKDIQSRMRRLISVYDNLWD